MKKSILIVLVTITMLSCGRPQNINIDELKREYIYEESGIYVENLLASDNSPDRYTIDNNVYTISRKFVFDYFIIRGGDTLKISAPRMSKPDSDFQREWEFVSHKSQNEDKIETISLAVQPGISNENQTMLKYEYQFLVNPGYSTFSSTSGVIENEMNTWMHPHRDKYFMILELNPFPFIQQPFELGNKWRWSLGIGDHWKDVRWKTWTGSITNNYEYEIIGKEILNTKVGEMDCWVIQSTATSPIGSTGLIAYYNEDNGFVKLDYINIDKSRLTVEIKDIK